MAKGNISNLEYAMKTKEYKFNKLNEWGILTRNITPSDIDGMYMTESSGNFLFFEFETTGKQMKYGQRKCFETLVYKLRPMSALIIADHEPIQSVEIPKDINSFVIVKYDEEPGKLVTTSKIEGSRICDWIKNWQQHADGLSPNHFVTSFRRRCGIYPGVPQI